MFILQIITLIYIIFVFYNIIELQKYNRNGMIIDLTDINYIINNDKIKEYKRLLNPILISVLNKKISLKNLIEKNKKYLIEDDKNIIIMNKIKDMKNVHIFKNYKICDDLLINNEINFDLDFLEDILLFNNKYSLSIFKNYQITGINFCRHNINIIYILDGEITIYLFNPKHKYDILNKKLDDIKKYSHKYNLKKSDLLMIPPNWYYIEEINTDTLHYHIDCDNYFTFLYNMFK